MQGAHDTRRRRAMLAIAAAAVLAAGCGSSSSSSSTSAGSGASSSSAPTASAQAAGQKGFEGVPIETGAALAPASTTQTGTVHGITCGPTEQLAYHIHVHLRVFVDGLPRQLPGGIGIPGSQVQNGSEGPVAVGGSCIYWLHTHAPDGVIHIESPTQRIYTLGEFFDEWHQPLSNTQVAGARGPVTALVGGKPWTAGVRAIPLAPRSVIQLAVGKPVPAFQPMSWSGTQL